MIGYLKPLLLLSLVVGCPNIMSGFQSPAEDSLLENGDFENWRGGQPVGWDISVGASSDSGDNSRSDLQQGSGPSLQLQGDARTGVWNLVSQTVALDPETAYCLEAVARAEGLQREGSQFDNCYVGIFLKTAEGRRVGQEIASVQSVDERRYLVPFKTSGRTRQGQVSIFLSKTGRLNVKSMKLEKLTLANSFDVLVADMDRHYSRFMHQGIDWNEVVSRYRERGQAATTPEQLVGVLSEMLAELQDMHVWIVDKGKTRAVTKSEFTPNYDFRIIDGDLKNRQSMGRLGLTGRTKDGFGYLRVTSLAGIEAPALAAALENIAGLFDAPGMIVDLRRNAGGAEPVAAAIAGLFTDKPVVYARQKFRSGPGHEEFFETEPRTLRPGPGRSYDAPVVCLIGSGAVSSGEALAAMMHAIPNCTLVGLPTRGASGNPRPVHLADGIDVYYSRWLSLMPDGSPIEGRGVQPDERVPHQRGQDPAYRRAVQILKGKNRP